MDSVSPSLEHIVLQYLAAHAGRAVSKRELIQALDIRKAESRAALRATLRDLERKGPVHRLRGNQWVLPDNRRRVTGVLRVHPHRFGFVTPDTATGEDVYIPEEGLSVALDGDRVLVEIGRAAEGRSRQLSRGEPVLARGRIVRVLERRRTRIVGRLCKTNWYWYVIPDSPRILHTIRIRTETGMPLHESHKVWVQLDEWHRESEPLTGSVVEDLGPADQSGVDILSVMRDHGIEADFPDDVVVEVRDTTARFQIENEIRYRTDLRKTLTITIDPAEAKDFDDAVSLETGKDGCVRLGVHIADVSFFVQPGTALDREAYLRGNSVYLVDRVIPMLPPELSSGLCSLQPGQDRLTYSVEIEFDTHGRVLSHRTFPSVIRSCARLTYDQVQNYFDGKSSADIPPPVQVLLSAMRQLAAVLRRRRMSQGSLDLWMPEIRCVLDETGAPVALLRRGADEAYNLIEEFMLAANRVIAERLATAEIPALYRVHPAPDKFQWEWMREELKALDINLHTNSREALTEIAKHYARSDKAHIVHLAILRNLKRACYSSQLAEHFGLAFTHYTHFTSPIRRYPDLIVHRLLKSLDQNIPPPLAHEEAARVAEHCSWTERNADDAEEESLDIKRFEYFARLLQNGETGPFPAVVVNITPKGPIVELSESLQRGLVPFRSMDHDYYVVNESRTVARGQRNLRVWQIGQPVQVVLMRVDRARRHIDFALANTAASSNKRRAKSRRR